MTDEIKKDVSGTAFLVNYSRSKMVDISRDLYARLWVTPETIALWDDLAQSVYPNDDLNLSLRNRFFLERLKRFIDENNDPVFVNIASGFTNYPFLVEAMCRFAELDLPNIIDFTAVRLNFRGRLKCPQMGLSPLAVLRVQLKSRDSEHSEE